MQTRNLADDNLSGGRRVNMNIAFFKTEVHTIFKQADLYFLHIVVSECLSILPNFPRLLSGLKFY